MGLRRGWAVLLLLVGCGAAHASDLESRVKAAFVYHFVQLTTWAEGLPDGPLDVCLLGDDPVAEALAALQGKAVGGRGVRTGTCAPGRRCGCEVVYVGRSEAGRLQADLAALGPGVLTVSDIPGFADRGGMIELVKRQGRLRFRIHRGRAARAGLRFDARLLALAEEVLP
ncbi:YfiR family protein [Deferrisoma camini]|uniref:YfiR family protein n=1 Tax=Deferrisoma camini TaxID=1035120 RepID=UPI00046CCAA2|nr:YfiR family protein [Deferrisoma camini]